MLVQNPSRWITNEVPRRFFRTWGFLFGVGIVVLTAFGILVFLLSRRYDPPLITTFLSAVLGASYIYSRRFWPREIGIGSDGLILKFPRGRQRFLAWKDIRQVTVMPGSWKDDEWARIFYRNGGEETQALIIGQAAHIVAAEFRAAVQNTGHN